MSSRNEEKTRTSMQRGAATEVPRNVRRRLPGRARHGERKKRMERLGAGANGNMGGTRRRGPEANKMRMKDDRIVRRRGQSPERDVSVQTRKASHPIYLP